MKFYTVVVYKLKTCMKETNLGGKIARNKVQGI